METSNYQTGLSKSNAHPHPPEKQKRKRSAALDGLKGFFILAIILYYYFQHLLPGGFLAVNGFLVVGGYLTFRQNKKTFAEDYQERFSWKSLKRMFFPMLFMIITTVATLFLVAPQMLSNIRGMALSALFFVNNDYQIFSQQSYFVQSANPSPFVQLWYVSLYVQLLIVGFLLRRLMKKMNFLRMQEFALLAFLTIASAVGMAALYWWEQDPSHVYYLVSTRLFSFTLGALLSYIHEGKLLIPEDHSNKGNLNIASIIGMGALIWMLVTFNGMQAEVYYMIMLVSSIVMTLLVSFALREGVWLHYIISFKGFTFFGKRSFSYYLWFYPIHLILPSFLRGVEDYWLNVLIQWITIIVLAEITYQLFEKERIPLPIGQAHSPYRLTAYMKSNLPKGLKHFGIAFSLVYLVFAGLAGIGFAQEKDQTSVVHEVEEKIRKNQELLQETTVEPTTEAVTTVNSEVKANIEQQVRQTPITFVGDSVLLASANKLREVFPNAYVDGEVGRQLYYSTPVVQKLVQQGRLSQTVVFVLGSNGAFASAQIDSLIQAAGNREIFLVTAGYEIKWAKEVNDQLKVAAERYPNVHLIDWGTYARGRTKELLFEDEIHPNDTGASEMANLILQEMVKLKLQ